MKLSSATLSLAIILLLAPGAAHALPTLSIDNTSTAGDVSPVVITGNPCSGAGCTTNYGVTLGTYDGLQVLNYSTQSAALKVVDGTNTDTLTLTNIVLKNTTNAQATFNIIYTNTFTGALPASQNYQVMLSALFGAPAGSSAAGDSVSLLGQVSFDAGVTTTDIGTLNWNVPGTLAGATGPLKTPTATKTSPAGSHDTLIGTFVLTLNPGNTFTMSGSGGVDQCNSTTFHPDYDHDYDYNYSHSYSLGTNSYGSSTVNCNDVFAAINAQEQINWALLAAQVPEPNSLLLIFSGLGVFALVGTKRLFG